VAGRGRELEMSLDRPDSSGLFRFYRNLKPRQQRAVDALLSGCSQEEAALKAGVTSRAIRKWRDENADFAAALRFASAEMVENASRRLVGSFDLAVDMLRGIVKDDAEKTSNKMRAAVALATLSLKYFELHDYQQMVQDLQAVTDELEAVKKHLEQIKRSNNAA
jgi:hypothetical protein